MKGTAKRALLQRRPAELAAAALAAAALRRRLAPWPGRAASARRSGANGAGEVFTIGYAAAPGETNVLDAQPLGSGAGFRLRDPVGIALANRCVRADPADVTTVVCEPRHSPGAPVEVSVDARLGDGNDTATVFSCLLDGGPGADRLISRGFLHAESVFRGGPGDDTMVAEAGEGSFDEGPRSNGADTIRARRPTPPTGAARTVAPKAPAGREGRFPGGAASISAGPAHALRARARRRPDDSACRVARQPAHRPTRDPVANHGTQLRSEHC